MLFQIVGDEFGRRARFFRNDNRRESFAIGSQRKRNFTGGFVARDRRDVDAAFSGFGGGCCWHRRTAGDEQCEKRCENSENLTGHKMRWLPFQNEESG